MGKRKPRGFKTFHKGGEVASADCVAEVVECCLATAYTRVRRWYEIPELDIDWLFKPLAYEIIDYQNLQKFPKNRPNVDFIKGEDVVNSSCVAEAVGCGLSTAYSRCEKWRDRPDLDFDWLFRPIEKKYNSRKYDSVRPAILSKPLEPKPPIVHDLSRDEEYRIALRKHKGL